MLYKITPLRIIEILRGILYSYIYMIIYYNRDRSKLHLFTRMGRKEIYHGTTNSIQQSTSYRSRSDP
nr:MAG TPA: hypothetical protein [Caudoviricetes sp.]